MKVIRILCLMLACTCFSLAADLSSLPPDAQKAISAAIEHDVARQSATAIEDFVLTASDGANGDFFGVSVAMDGNTAVVGALDAFGDVGAAYVFVKPGGGWRHMTETAKLTPSEGNIGEEFGATVNISGNTVVIGAPSASVGGVVQGAAYVFVKPDTGWKDMTETAKLLATDGADGALFGAGVGASGNTIVVGAAAGGTGDPSPGTAYIFVEPAGGWTDMTQTAELTASDGVDYNDFGYSVGISGNTVIVGAYEDSFPNQGPGAAYVFVEPQAGWANMTETAKLTASDGKVGDAFGFSVSIAENTAVAGAVYNDDYRGAAYVFVEPPDGWSNMTQTAKLSATGGGQLRKSQRIRGNCWS